MYGRQAAAVSQALRGEAPGLALRVNPAKPRRGSFEVTLLLADGGRAELWSGLQRGPPRKLKFPEPAEVAAALRKHLP